MQTDHNEDQTGNTTDSTVLSRQVERWITAFNTKDIASIVDLYAKNAELFDSGMRHARKGRHEIKQWFTQRFQQMPTIQYIPQQSFFNEKEAAIHWLARGHTPPFLRQRWLIRAFEVDGVSIFHIEEGLIVWQHGYYDHLQIVEKVLLPLRWLPVKL